MSIGFFALSFLLAILFGIGIYRRGKPFPGALKRWIEQFAKLVPRMFCALIAAGFIGKLIPSEYISQFLGADAGLKALFVAALVGLCVPAGPVISFSIAAIFVKSGASTPALITFITSWSLYAAHRIFIYELPLLGPSFLRVRSISVAVVPICAGLLAMMFGMITDAQDLFVQ